MLRQLTAVLRPLRLLVATSIAVWTLASPICHAQALDEHECCCAHEETEPPARQRIEDIPCGCASPDDGAQHTATTAATGTTASAHDVRAALPALRLELPRILPSVAAPTPPAARPPPNIILIETTVLRR